MNRLPGVAAGDGIGARRRMGDEECADFVNVPRPAF